MDIYNLFGIRTVNREKYWITINSPYKDFTETLKDHLIEGDRCILPKILIVYVIAERTKNVPIPNTIDLSAISLSNEKEIACLSRIDNKWYADTIIFTELSYERIGEEIL